MARTWAPRSSAVGPVPERPRPSRVVPAPVVLAPVVLAPVVPAPVVLALWCWRLWCWRLWCRGGKRPRRRAGGGRRSLGGFGPHCGHGGRFVDDRYGTGLRDVRHDGLRPVACGRRRCRGGPTRPRRRVAGPRRRRAGALRFDRCRYQHLWQPGRHLRLFGLLGRHERVQQGSGPTADISAGRVRRCQGWHRHGWRSRWRHSRWRRHRRVHRGSRRRLAAGAAAIPGAGPAFGRHAGCRPGRGLLRLCLGSRGRCTGRRLGRGLCKGGVGFGRCGDGNRGSLDRRRGDDALLRFGRGRRDRRHPRCRRRFRSRHRGGGRRGRRGRQLIGVVRSLQIYKETDGDCRNNPDSGKYKRAIHWPSR